MEQQGDSALKPEGHEAAGSMRPTATRSTRAKSPKPSKTPPGRRPLKLSLPVEVIGKLQLHAIQEGISVSALVSRLAREHCNEWTIHRTPSRASAEA